LKKIIVFNLFSLVLYTCVYCGQVNRIELTDGSIINGEIVSYANGIYIINTANFGEIKIEAKKVSKIESENSLAASAKISSVSQSDNLVQSGIDVSKQELMGDLQNTAIIAQLAADSQIQEIAKDPKIQEAVKSGDIQTLMKSEKFMNIVNNPQMQETLKKLKQ
jgi:hypothetical protein